MITYLNGVEQNEIGKLFKSKAERKERKAARKERFASKHPKLAKAIQKIKAPIVKVAGTPMRLAFLGIVRINFLHFATKLQAAIIKDPKKISDLWTKFGGNFDELKKVVDAGAKKKGNYNKDEKLSGVDGLGVAGEGASAAMAIATPIILALLPILKSLGADKAGDTIEEAAQAAGIIEEGQETFINTNKIEEGEEDDDDETPFYKDPVKMALIIGGVGLASFGIYKLSKRK